MEMTVREDSGRAHDLGPVERNDDAAPPPRPSTLVELLRERARRTPDSCAYVFLVDGETDERRLTYAELDARARAIGARLQAMELADERALLLFPPGLDYVAAFFGCLYARVIPVPAYPPTSASGLPRIVAIAGDCAASAALTTSGMVAPLRAALDLPLAWVATDEFTDAGGGEWTEPGIAPGDLAFLQYTSGSTRTPRGVMLTHGNLLHNLGLMHEWFVGTTENAVVSWLPPYHDMGLIGCILEPLYGGFPAVLMSPAAFLERPVRWLDAISRYRATVTAAPNFAYELCLLKVDPRSRPSLDLSSLRVAVNGAEPVRRDTIERFTERFSANGFRPGAMRPCYGLAEATLLVTSDPAGTLPDAVLAADATRVVCGTATGGQRLVVVDPTLLTPAAPGQVGEIWLSGPSVARGYWGRPTETAALFEARLAGDDRRYLRTGDLGCLDEAGRLVVTGRSKDLIVIRGRNHYPQDVELAVERSHPAFRPGCGAAFAVIVDGEERLVVAYEVVEGADLDAAVPAARRALRESCEVDPYAVVLIEARTIAKTPSGKVRRRACREAYLSGTLAVVGGWRAPEGGRSATYVAPRDPVEELLAGIYADLLGVDRVGVHDDFTAAGGDSLLVNRLVTRIRAALPVEVSLGDVFEAPTVAQLAGLLSTRALLVDEEHLYELLADPKTP
jgi:acyl-CoA synthetase (AMP-forming)/AMP-acid ligase II/aryl carrier-like protein